MYDKIYNEILCYFPTSLKSILKVDKNIWDIVEEIRVRVGQPLYIKLRGTDILLDDFVKTEDILMLLESFSNNSIYSVQSELNNGYITIKGGHRVGITGTSIIESGEVKNLKYISSMNIRIARQVLGSADRIINYIYSDKNMGNVLIVSPPRMWKDYYT